MTEYGPEDLQRLAQAARQNDPDAFPPLPAIPRLINEGAFESLSRECEQALGRWLGSNAHLILGRMLEAAREGAELYSATVFTFKGPTHWSEGQWGDIKNRLTMRARTALSRVPDLDRFVCRTEVEIFNVEFDPSYQPGADNFNLALEINWKKRSED